MPAKAVDQPTSSLNDTPLGRQAGAEGVHPESGITNINTVEIPIKQAMIASANRTIVLADSSKLGYKAFSHVRALDAITKVITDDQQVIKHRQVYADKL